MTEPLEPVGQLAPQDWMTAPETRAVIKALTAEGAEVRFVGGCVRDAVLKRPIRDIDIATHEPPERVMELLRKADILVIPTGIAHGTVTAVVNKTHFEITTLRCDVETFGRHARVAFTDDWAEDAARRDFTINTLFCAPDGMIYDPFDGLQDLAAGRVRFVGNAQQRIEEDVLRLLRFFRFHAYYGRPPADTAALAACRAMAHQLPRLSGERVYGEVMKLLLAPDPAGIFLMMQGEQVLPFILPEAADFGRLRLVAWLESRALVMPSLHPDPIRRLAALVATDAAGAEKIAERLRMSNKETKRLIALAAPRARIEPGLDRQARRRILRHLGAEEFRDLTLLAWATHKAAHARPAPGETEAWVGLLQDAESWLPVALPIKGRDLIELGLRPGPRLGAVLAEVDRWWEAGDYQAGRDDCLAKARDLIAAEG